MSNLNDRMGESLLPQGMVAEEDGSYFQGREGIYLSSADSVVNVEITSDEKRLNGCCGLDGCDGPNLKCKNCGVYVATKMTDCWMPHCVAFEPEATEPK